LEDAEAGNANAVRILRSETYAEVLLALCLLERVSPREQVRQATNRLLNRLATSPVTAVPPPTSRTIEALAQAYLLREDKRLGNITFELGVLLLKVQLTPSTAESPDLVGGFRERTLALHTLTAAQAVNAMSAAYAVGRSLKLRADFFGAPVRNGAHFLMTMQFREENSFYLPQGNVARGGFRKSVDDLILQTAPTAESVRALIAAAAVTAETIKSPPPGAPKKEAT
jgi:hypothetical protein